MNFKGKIRIFKFYDFKNFSAREAVWLAVLLHLILILLPKNLNPFAFFWRDFEPVRPEPLTFNITQPEIPEDFEQSEIVPQEERHEAISPEKIDGPPETDQPNVTGETNLKTMEAPFTREQRPREQANPPAEFGRVEAEPLEREPVISEQRTQELAQKLKEELENSPWFKLADFPITYNNRKPSQADQLDNIIQFDTYDWNYEPYRDKMIRKLYQFWVPKLRNVSYFLLGHPGRTVYRFTINRDGSVTSVVLLGPSGLEPYDLAAHHSIRAPYPGMATEFPALPLHFPKDFLTVTIGYFVNTEIPDRYNR